MDIEPVNICMYKILLLWCLVSCLIWRVRTDLFFFLSFSQWEAWIGLYWRWCRECRCPCSFHSSVYGLCYDCEYMKIIHVYIKKWIWKWSSQFEHYLSSRENKAWENSGLYGIWTHDLCDTAAVLYQLSYQDNWELVIMLVPNKPVVMNEWLWISENLIDELWIKRWIRKWSLQSEHYLKNKASKKK